MNVHSTDDIKNEIIEIISELIKWSLIDTTGGAISKRVDNNSFIISPTGSAFRRWKTNSEDLVHVSNDGDLIDGNRKGPAGVLLHCKIYKHFHKAQAIIHTHAPWSLTYAALEKSVPSTLNLSDTLGEVPCLGVDDAAIKKEFNQNPDLFPAAPSSMPDRPDVALINMRTSEQIIEKLANRSIELDSHGIGFTIRKHGIFVMARNLDEAFDNLGRIEASARTSLFQLLLKDA